MTDCRTSGPSAFTLPQPAGSSRSAAQALRRDDAVARLAGEALSRLVDHARGSSPPSAAEVDRLCRALISRDPEDASRIVHRQRQVGAGLDDFCLSLLAAAARRLGEWWDEDLLSFAHVTIGCSRIHSLIRGPSRHIGPLKGSSDHRSGSALFASVPGEQHTLGVTMAAETFRRRGWSIELLVGHTQEELVARLTASKPRVVGLSASGVRSLSPMGQLMDAVRRARPSVRVMVCGQLVAEAPGQVERLLPDATARDMAAALSAMEILAGTRPARPDSGRPRAGGRPHAA